jgi:hypothetical protein
MASWARQEKGTRNLQKGVSLISLMIGLLVSMVCILSSLTLYKNLVQVSAEAKIDTLHDGQLAGALLTLQLEIQNAGYQIANAGDTDVVRRVNGTSLELLWRYNDSGFRCRGLIESAVVDNGMTYRVLNLVEAVAGCDGAVVLTTLDWSPVVASLGRWPVREGLATYMTGRTSMLDITIAPIACSPYGAVIPEDHLMVTISGPSSSRVNIGASGAMTTFKYCLMNT